MFDDEQVLESTFKFLKVTEKAARMRRVALWRCNTTLSQQGAPTGGVGVATQG